MMTLENVKNNLRKLIGQRMFAQQIRNEIIICYEDYEEFGETEVIVNLYAECCYINAVNTSIIEMDIEKNGDLYTIKKID